MSFDMGSPAKAESIDRLQHQIAISPDNSQIQDCRGSIKISNI